ncbi:MAG TPA: class I SAM-dependent methyltransferase [Solirubrobacterales bacterium]|nr:class I SAM-dependent methyltransferase [Solirubrobacterales bacterium]
MSENTTQTPRGFDALEVAEELAPTWASRREQIEAVSAPCREAMLRDLDPQPGDTVLELAAGTGDTGFDAAERVGADGRLISSDFAPTMLDEARKRGAERGVEDVEYEVIDATQIELEDDSVDGVLCRFGYMLMTDVEAALSETRRVLRPGGKVSLAVWGSPEKNPFFMIPAISLIQRGHMPPPEPPPAPGIFSMADPERIKGLLRSAGFEEVRVGEVDLTFPIPNAEEYLEFMADTAGPLAIALRGLDEEQRAKVLGDVEDSLERFAADGGYELPGLALCAVGS